MQNNCHCKKFYAIFMIFVFAVTIFSGFFAIPPKAEAVKWETIIGVAASHIMINNSLNYYNGKGRNEIIQQFKESEGVSSDPDANRQLGSIMSRLTTAIAKTDESVNDPPYNYFVNKDQTFNAFCTLGHNLSVNIGVFTFFDYHEDRVAAVVAHEIAHGQKKHPIRGARRKLTVDLVAAILGDEMNTAGKLATGIVAAHAKNTGITKPNEKEADNMSFTYMAEAGYNVGATAAVWQRMIEQSGKKGKDFFGHLLSPSTHPGNEWRRDNFTKKMHEYSNKKVNVNHDTGEVTINKKVFTAPAELGNLSGKERSYLVAGTLAGLYSKKKTLTDKAFADGNILMIGQARIMQCGPNDLPAAELAARLNEIK